MKYIGSKAKIAADIVPILHGILVGCCDYRQMRFPTREKVLIYCDPPYAEGVGYENISIPPHFGNGAENAPRKGISSLSANTPRRPILLACGSGA